MKTKEKPKIDEKTRGKWFCVICGRPINAGYSWRGLCVICAEPFLSPDYRYR